MSLLPAPDHGTARPSARVWVMVRIAGVVMLVAAIAAASWWLHSPGGKGFLRWQHLEDVGVHFRQWTVQHPLTAGGTFLGLYVLLAVLALPLWWLQIVGGVGLGLCKGFVLSTVAAAIGAVAGQWLSRTLIGAWFQQRIVKRKATIEKIDQRLGHNGLLVVMALRLLHLTPFGLSNYLFGVTRIRVRDVLIGTLIGGIPTLLFYTGLGSGHYGWQYWGALVGLDGVLLLPVAVRWVKIKK